MTRQCDVGPGPGPGAAGGVGNVLIFADDAVAASDVNRFVPDDVVQFADRRVDLAVEIVPAAGREEHGGEQQAAEASVHGKLACFCQTRYSNFGVKKHFRELSSLSGAVSQFDKTGFVFCQYAGC